MRDDVPFISALFDFSFSSFVAEKLIRVLYILLLILILIVAVITVFTSFMGSFWTGILSLIFAPIGIVVFAVLARVWLEFIVVIFRIADYAKTIAENSARSD